jgi:hypothetical protein
LTAGGAHYRQAGNINDNQLIALLAVTAAIVFVLTVWLTPRISLPPPLFGRWQDFLAALQQSRSAWDKALVLAGLIASLWRPSIWGCLLVCLGIIGSAIWIIGGLQLPQAIRAIRDVLMDFYDFIRSLTKQSAKA